MGSRMKNGMKRPLSQMASGLALSTMLTGCLYGENQQFFDHRPQSGNEDGRTPANDNSGEATSGTNSTPTTTPEPSPIATASPSPSPTAVPSPTSTPMAVVTPTPPQVCDPLSGNEGDGSKKNGIKGKLYSYEDSALSSHPPQNVGDFFQWGTPQNADLFLSKLYTPTRAFDSGFMTSDGEILKKSNGSPLFEYFALKLSGGIQLPQGAANKKVQFAILSDDGAKLRMLMTHSTDTGVTIVNNDGGHPTRMACASIPVQVSANARVPFELDYYQGPRMHIALILLWREYQDGMNMNDPWCGQSGNDLFFDSSHVPSRPQSAYNDLMNRWEVVPSNVFYIDGFGNHPTDADNPCSNP